MTTVGIIERRSEVAGLYDDFFLKNLNAKKIKEMTAKEIIKIKKWRVELARVCTGPGAKVVML